MRKAIIIAFVIGIALLLMLGGCATGRASSPPPRPAQGPVGGGCGVGYTPVEFSAPLIAEAVPAL